jgi:hypothetical protein
VWKKVRNNADLVNADGLLNMEFDENVRLDQDVQDVLDAYASNSAVVLSTNSNTSTSHPRFIYIYIYVFIYKAIVLLL